MCLPIYNNIDWRRSNHQVVANGRRLRRFQSRRPAIEYDTRKRKGGERLGFCFKEKGVWSRLCSMELIIIGRRASLLRAAPRWTFGMKRGRSQFDLSRGEARRRRASDLIPSKYVDVKWAII